MKQALRTIVCFVVLMAVSVASHAQCAMCRATLENNVSNGEAGIGATINFGILYLFAMPYLLAATIGYFWYKKSKQNASKKQYRSSIGR